MHRCYVRPSDWNDSQMRLPPEEVHHLVDVLRARDGESVAVFDGRGRTAVAVLGLKGGSGAELRVTGPGEGGASLAVPGVVLIQAIPKGARMETIVEKAVELGAGAIWPVITERTIVRLAGADARRARSERWQRIALSASRQCGTSWVPDVQPVSDLPDALERCGGFDLFLVGSLEKDAARLKNVLAEHRAPRSVAILIGPEGDLSPGELAAAKRAGALPVSFGSLVLRVDTAAIYALSVLANEYRG